MQHSSTESVSSALETNAAVVVVILFVVGVVVDAIDIMHADALGRMSAP